MHSKTLLAKISNISLILIVLSLNNIALFVNNSNLKKTKIGLSPVENKGLSFIQLKQQTNNSVSDNTSDSGSQMTQNQGLSSEMMDNNSMKPQDNSQNSTISQEPHSDNNETSEEHQMPASDNTTSETQVSGNTAASTTSTSTSENVDSANTTSMDSNNATSSPTTETTPSAQSNTNSTQSSQEQVPADIEVTTIPSEEIQENQQNENMEKPQDHDQDHEDVDEDKDFQDVFEKLKELGIDENSDFHKYIKSEIKNYSNDKENFKPTCYEYMKNTENQEVAGLSLITFSNVPNKDDQFKEYIVDCSKVYKDSENAKMLIQKLRDYEKNLENEINDFNKQYPRTWSEIFMDCFFSYSFFKKNLFSSMVGKDKHASMAKEYEDQIFKFRRLDKLIDISFETLLFHLHEENEEFYNNNKNKLKQKERLEDMTCEKVQETPEYIKWSEKFSTEFPDLTLTQLNKRFCTLFPSIIQNFKQKLNAQNMMKQSISNSTINH